jgi:hypothetical protein
LKKNFSKKLVLDLGMRPSTWAYVLGEEENVEERGRRYVGGQVGGGVLGFRLEHPSTTKLKKSFFE